MLNSRAFRWISFMGWAALIAYLMLTPGEDTPVEKLSGFFGGTDLSDWFGHVVLFGVFTVLLYRVRPERPRPIRILIACIGIALAYGTLTEMLQLIVPHRGANLMDMVGNWVGAMIMGAVLYRRG